MIFIVGAGINGFAIGFKLLSQGFDVKIFDYEQVGEPSSVAVGMLAPLIEAKPYELSLFNLMLESKNQWLNFSKKLTIDSKFDIQFKKNSSLMIANNFDELEKIKFKRRFIESIGFNVEMLDRDKTLRLEPLLSENAYASLFCKEQDQVNPKLLRESLKISFLKNGGKIEKQKINKVLFEKNKVGVKLNNQKIFASKVVISSGVWSNQIIENSFKISLPLKPIKGVTISIQSPKNAELIKHNLWFKNIYVAPRNDGKIIVGATEDERGFETIINTREIYYLTKNLWENLPFIQDYEIIEFKSGLRPGTCDGLPIIGSINHISKDIICAFGHYRHGVLLAPITSEIVCSYISEEKIPEKFKCFSPNRFSLK